ncbi:MAG: helix-turn-helix domain-containing protein [Halioglobus sp.]
MELPAGQQYTHSVEEQALAVDPWEINLRQISGGSFLGNMHIASLGDILLYRDCWSQRTLATGALPKDYFLLATGVNTASGIQWCGSDTNDRLLAVAPPNTEIDFIMPAHSAYIAVLLPISYWNLIFGEQVAGKSPRPAPSHVHCDSAQGKYFVQRLNQIIDRYQVNPARLDDGLDQLAAQTVVLDVVSAIARGPDTPAIRASAGHRTLKRALEYGEALREKISVPHFAEQLEVSQRSLELSFKQCLGITPRQYLSLQRMHGVHTELLQRTPRSRCVTEVATAWGFSELGRFAGEYKRVFGELPTHTLNREQQRTLRCFRDLLH